jgi:hypothetical protein
VVVVLLQACGVEAEPSGPAASAAEAALGGADTAEMDDGVTSLSSDDPDGLDRGGDVSEPAGTDSLVTRGGDDAEDGPAPDGEGQSIHDVEGAAVDDVGSGTSTAPCMGSKAHCARPYNQFAQVCTHNAMANGEDGFTLPAPNQAYSFTAQLDDGVRCMMLDTYEHKGEPYLCHAACGIWGQRPLLDGLQEIAAWMTDHPREVVTFIMQSDLDEEVFHQSLVEAGLADASGEPTSADVLYFHDAPPGTPWPTLGAMLDGNQRLVVFTDDTSANGAWHLDWQVYGWETPYNDPEFTCEDGRGDPTAYDHQVFILNHYTLCALGGCVANALANNAFAFALERAQACWHIEPAMNPWGQIPTFINVDNYHVPTIGGQDDRADIFEVVEALNNMWPGPP